MEKFLDYSVYHDQKIECTIVSNKEVNILILGYILDPFNPNHSNHQIAATICEHSKNIDTLFKNIQKYSGRYVILYSNGLDFITLTDAMGLRQLYFTTYENNFVMSSSPKMILDSLNIEPEISEATLNLLQSDNYKFDESPWYGEFWYDKRIKKVLPNHYLNLHNNVIHRTPLFFTALSENETLDRIKEILTGSFHAIINRYDKIMQPLTAGIDSRVLLAASKPLCHKINYYLFINNPKQLEGSDAIISSKLASRLNLRYNIISTLKLEDEFLKKFSDICFYPRILPKTSNIQWHYYENSDKNMININGNGGETLRRRYARVDTGEKINIKSLFALTNYSLFNSDIEKWYEETLPFSKEYKLNILDLFHWEQRMGHWHALYQYEQDIAIEEFSPFNNKELVLTVLKVDPDKRKYFKCTFFIELMEQLWPEVLSEPINPKRGFNLKRKIPTLIKKSPRLYIFLKRIKKSWNVIS